MDAGTSRPLLMGAALVGAGAVIGVAAAALALVPLARRVKESRREEAGLALEIAKLTHQLAAKEQRGGSSSRGGGNSGNGGGGGGGGGGNAGVANGTANGRHAAAEGAKPAHVQQAAAVIERAQAKSSFRRNDSADDLADVLAVHRQRYQSWRKGNHIGAKTTHERMLTRQARSSTQGELSDMPDFRNSGQLTTHLWQHLNLGPSSASQRPIKITVIGGGAFGTAMAAAAGRNGHHVVIYLRRREVAREIKLTQRNEHYLPGCLLPKTVTATCNLEEALTGTGMVIHALPAQRSPDWIKENKHLIPSDVIYCSTAKGLHLDSQSLLSEAMLRAFDRDQPFAVLSGPSFAKEIVNEQPTSVVVASKRLADAVRIQRVMSSTTFRVYASQDTVGVELGGALKNPLALGAGLIEGLGFGINTMSAYVTRSCAELTSLCVAMGGRPETVSGLSGIGDLMLTAFGSLSRNRSCGIRLVQGETLQDILSTTTVEGVPTAKVAVAFAEQCNLHLPIFRTVNSILEGKLKPEDFVVTAIMTRPLTMETHTTPLSEVEATTKAAHS